MFSKGGMGEMMKKAQEMQEKMQQAQAELAKTEVIGESGAGLVKVTLLGNYNVRKIDVDESLMSDEKEMVEDLIAAAMNDAVRRVDETKSSKMNGVATGMGVPPGMEMPF